LLGDKGTAVDLVGVSVLAPASLGPVIESAGRSGLVVVVENHAPHGGFADSVAAAVCQLGVAVHRFTLPKEFLPAADPEWLLSYCGLSGPHIAARIDDILATQPSEVQ
jgi:transketolase